MSANNGIHAMHYPSRVGRNEQYGAEAPPVMMMSTAGQHAPRVDKDLHYPEIVGPDIQALNAAWEGVQHKFIGRLAADSNESRLESLRINATAGASKAMPRPPNESDTCSTTTTGSMWPVSTTPPAKDFDKTRKKTLRPCSFKRRLYQQMLEDSQKMILQSPEAHYLHNFEVLDQLQTIEPCIKAKMYDQLDQFAAEVRKERLQATLAQTTQVFSF